MSTKRRRPYIKSEDKLEVIVTTRMTVSEQKQLIEEAANQNLSLSYLLRQKLISTLTKESKMSIPAESKVISKIVPNIVLEKIKQLTFVLEKYSQFKIILNDGTEFGSLEVRTKAVPKELTARAKSRLKLSEQYGYGVRTAYVRKYLENLPAGEIAEIPLDEYSAAALRKVVTPLCTTLFGKGNSAVEATRDAIVVLRYQ